MEQHRFTPRELRMLEQVAVEVDEVHIENRKGISQTRYIMEVRFLKGRLKFEKDGEPILDKNGRPQSAPFPSCIVIFYGS